MAGTDQTRDPLLGGPAIILIEPQMGENIGTAARAMLNCGLTDLRLVRPRDGWPNPKAVPTASGAAALILVTSAAKSACPASVERSAATLILYLANSLVMESRPPLPKSLLTQTMATDFAFSSSLMYFATFGIEDCWPNEVRNRYLLPVVVSSAASPPMICAMPASAASGAVTFTEPE